jgi:hypothetical protein
MRKVVLVSVAAALTWGALSSAAVASHAWSTYHWARTANPFTIKLGDNVTSAWDSYLSMASSDWSADTAGNPLNTTVVTGVTKPRNCRPTSGRVEVCNAAYGYTGWLGMAQIWLSGGHIVQATSKMNDSYFSSPTYNTRAWRAHVMCQEVGHTFGLDHQDESGADLGTCMDYASNPDLDNMHPNAHDYEQLAAIYAHTDGTATIGAATTNAGRGLVVRRDRVDRSTIVDHFSNGTKRVTEIYWAIPF